jgi:hypothetical protein
LPRIRLDGWQEGAAVCELVDRYLRRYGPVSESDIAWWTGLPKAAVRTELGVLPNVVHVSIEGSSDVFLAHQRDLADARCRCESVAEQVALLPVLDPYLQGYRQRGRCVEPAHLPFVVDRSANSTSVVLIGGRVAGVWDMVAKPSPELRVCFFGAPDAATRARVLGAANDTAEFLTGAPAPVIEADHMTPLPQGTAGAFLSPLKNAH